MNSFQDVIIALKERQAIVLKYPPPQQKAINLQITTSVIEIAENLHQIKDDLKGQFIADLLVGATRNWEALDQIGEKPRFQQLKIINLEITYDLIIRIQKQDNLQLKIYEFQEEIDKAKRYNNSKSCIF